MKSLVTGGAGFIGSHLVDKLLSLNHQVTVIDNLSTGRKSNLDYAINKIDFINADLAIDTINLLNSDQFDYCFHLAALADIVPSIQNPIKYFNSNVLGTMNILKIIEKSNLKKFIYIASSSCYGIPKNYPTKEDEKISPQYPYALTKRIGEEIVMHWSQVYKLPAISLRLFNVYGPRSRTTGTYGAVFGVFLAQKLAKKPYTVVGSGEQTRDFTYVSDIVEAIISSMNSDINYEIFNIGSENTYSINQLVKLLDGPVEFIPKRPGEPDCTWADISKAKKLLNWEPKISLENGVAQMLKNIDYWKDAPLWDKDSIAKETKDWFKFLS